VTFTDSVVFVPTPVADDDVPFIAEPRRVRDLLGLGVENGLAQADFVEFGALHPIQHDAPFAVPSDGVNQAFSVRAYGASRPDNAFRRSAQ
jgi:hypothetical protein